MFYFQRCDNALATYAEPIIGALPVQTVDTALVMKVLEQEVRDAPDKPTAPLWTARPETASRLRGRMESILDWAKVRGRSELEMRARRRKIARVDAVRAEIVLLAADGMNNCAIAATLGVSRLTVGLWQKRFAKKRFDGL